MIYKKTEFKEIEIYKTIGFKTFRDYDNYLIYENGEIYSKKQKKFLKFKDINGYKSIGLYNEKEKKQKYFLVHRIIYETFKGEIPLGYQIDHINGLRDDNNLNNLRLLTAKENINNKHNLDIYKEINKKYYLKYKDKKKIYNQKYYQLNKDYIKKQHKIYYNSKLKKL